LLAEESVIEKVGIGTKIRDYAILMKTRLSILVVVSAIATFFLAGGLMGLNFIYLVAGGFLITAASNTFNQIIERDLDSKMDRTKHRPVAAGRMGVIEAAIFGGLFAIIGALLLFNINFLSGVLGVLAMVMYVALYTPLKKISSWAVFVGAFPGAIPPMLGVVAATNEFGLLAGLMFLTQFVWQFPHFWAIAWIKDDDYKKGGFSLLPSKSRKSKVSAFYILIYSLFLIPASLLPWAFNFTGQLSLIIGTVLGILFFVLANRLYLDLEDKSAKTLMFASFIYLPLIQFLYVFDKLPLP
jgi:heme o synthase